MTRSLLLVVFYGFVGTLVAMVGYRLVLDGPLSPPDAALPFEGIVILVSILLNTALLFAASGLVAAMVYSWLHSFAIAALASVALAAIVALLMMFWFPGLSYEFPVIVALSALVCAGLALLLGLFTLREVRRR